jgi:uncharacterized membrane protein/uncharacterized protein YfkK (UPF0435 family)
MSTKIPQNQEDQEIDLSQVYTKISAFFQEINAFLFRCIHFFVKNKIIVAILFFIGVGIGFYLDTTTKAYDHQIIVTPNFGSTDYLYSKINLIESKIIENDTAFLKNTVGIINPKVLKKIEIKPITDVYKFIENKPENFELIKLLAEDGDIKKIVEDNLTSKNYNFHTISFVTDKLINDKEMVQPLLRFFNNSEYYSKIQQVVVTNIQAKMVENDTIISQINGVLSGFSSKASASQKSEKLVYYNENTQLNDVIKTKDMLISEQGMHRIELVGSDKIIKESSTTINIQNSKLVNGKLKLILPFLLILAFILLRLFIAFYRKQSQKAAQINA